jgi:hypothetical protein
MRGVGVRSTLPSSVARVPTLHFSSEVSGFHFGDFEDDGIMGYCGV